MSNALPNATLKNKPENKRKKAFVDAFLVCSVVVETNDYPHSIYTPWVGTTFCRELGLTSVEMLLLTGSSFKRFFYISIKCFISFNSLKTFKIVYEFLRKHNFILWLGTYLYFSTCLTTDNSCSSGHIRPYFSIEN